MIHHRLWQLAGRIPGPLALAVCAGLIASALSVGQALLVAAAVVALFEEQWAAFTTWLLLAVLSVLVRSAVTWARTVLTAWIAGRVRDRMRATLLTRLAAIGPDGVAETRSGLVRSTVTEGVDSLAAYYSTYLPQLAVTMVVPIGVVIGVCTVNLPAGSILAVAVLLALVVPRWKDRELVRVGRLRWDEHYDLAADYLQALQGMATLRSFGADGRTRDALEHRSQRLYRATMAELRVSLLENGLTAMVVQLGTAGAIAAAAWWVTGNHEGPGAAGAATAVVTVLLLAAECFRPVKDLSTAWHAGYLGVTAIDGIDALLGAPIPLPDNGTQPVPWSGRPPVLRVESVRLRYSGATHDALGGVGHTFAAGSVTAVVGPSGAGKSTLGRLLVRLRDPDSGAVSANGTDLRDIPLAALRSAGMAWVEQHPFLLAGTVAANLRLAAPEATEQELWAALGSVGAADFVRALPSGLEEVLEENGRNLSGGQRQRLALARALLTRPSVLVLDEVTSHLDASNAQLITDTLLSLRGRCTTIVIAHRLETAVACDEVVVLEAGRIVQQGVPAQLADRPGLFAQLLTAAGAS